MKTRNYLAEPIRVGRLTLKNRMIMVAMHHLYTEDGLPTPRFCEYYWKRAEGGAAMVVVGACRFDDYGARLSTMSLREDSCAPAYREFTDGMHSRGCLVAVQLYHAGRYMYRNDVIADDEAIAPSAVYTPFTRETAREMTRQDMSEVVANWAQGARRAKEAGFDAVEISGSAGYLISQFLSPLANVRTDEYGGSFENRCRFPLEVISAVRAAVGEDYTVILRLGSHDLVPGSSGPEDCVEFAKRAEGAGIDMLDITGGWHESRIPQLTQEVPRGGLVHLARGIKQAVSIPVAMANRLGDPRTAQQAVALGYCDIVAMGRPLVADPELPAKVLAGRPETIRPCVACNQGCLAGTFFEKPVRCLTNGLAGREYLIKCERAVKKKRLLVVGGGPAGCECAVRAASRGHEVTLWESAEALGGQLALAAALPFRYEFAGLIGYYAKELSRLGVKVENGRQATAPDVLAEGFDEVVLAVGRKYKAIALDTGKNAPPVYTAEQVISQGLVLGRRVAVIGGSFVGLEAARMLAMEGSLGPDRLFYLMRYGVEPPEKLQKMLSETDRHVAVFERGKIGAGYEPGIAWPVLGDLTRLGAELFKNTGVIRLEDGGVLTENGLWPCDAVVVAVGTQEDNGLYDELASKLPCRKIGNAQKLGRAIEAIEAGAVTGCEV